MTEGHRAAGVLLDRDLVLVPQLPRSLLCEVSAYELLLVPLPQPNDLPADRIKPSYIEAHGVKGGTGDVAAFIRLARPSSLFRNGVPQALVEEEHLPAVPEGESLDLWSLLEDTGVSVPARHCDPAEVLEHAWTTGVVVTAPAVNVLIHDSVNTALRAICEIFHFPPCPK